MRVDLPTILLLLCASPWGNEGGGSIPADSHDDGLWDRRRCEWPVDGNETPRVGGRCGGGAALGTGGDGGRPSVCCWVNLLRSWCCGTAGGLGEWAGALLHGSGRFERAGEQQPGECDGGAGGIGLERGGDGGGVDPARRESGGGCGCCGAGGRHGGRFACRSAAGRNGYSCGRGVRREWVGDRCAVRERGKFAAGLPEQRRADGGRQFFDVGRTLRTR